MPDPTSRLSAALSDRYRLERELGQGGMATVYLAEDLKHHRQVAIKVLRPELAAVLGADRFVQEITTTAQLQHPHILPLFDSGSADGFLFYVMPYIEGETLRDKLSRETQLGVDEAIQITTEVADALDYAHRHGVIHRDIKPENILLHDGRPMVADFGIALAVSAAAGGRMTETGMSLGTPHYMSPEQATAERDITGRSDIYSLGAVLYEMLTGAPPHTGTSAQQIIMKIVTEEAAPVTKLRKSVPLNIAAALGHALEKLPADRFDSAKAFAEALANPHFTTTIAAASTEVSGGARSWVRDPRSVAAMSVAVVAIAGLVWAVGSRAKVSAGPAVYDVGLPDSAPLAVAAEQAIAVASSGDFIVYQAQEQGGSALWFRSLRDATSRRIDGTDQGQRPAISPDGSRVAFVRFRKPPGFTLEVVPLDGGATTTLGDGAGEVNLQWLDDGRIQVSEGDNNHVRWFDPGGGPITGHRSVYCVLPSPLPDGKRVLCGGGAYMWAYVTDLGDATAASTPLWTGSSDSTWVFGSGFQVVDERYLVYLSLGGDLLAARVDLATQHVGRSVRLVTGIDRSGYWGAGTVALSRGGTLVYAHGPNRAVGNLVATGSRAFDTLDVGRDAFLRFSVSPDGRRLAAVVAGLQGEELRIYDLNTGEYVMWVRHPEIRQPTWSPRSDRLMFSWNDSVFVGDPDQSQAPQLMFVAPGTFEAFAWMSGERLIGGDWDHDLAIELTLDTTPPTWDTLATGASFPAISPDGRWLAYNDPNLTTLWLAPVPSNGRRYQVATGSLAEPHWRSNRELVFSSYTQLSPSIVRVTVGLDATAPSFSRSTLTELPDFVETAGQSSQLTPDGRVLYVRTAADEPKRYLRVVPNWVAQMKRAVDAANR